jgi:hypothetical protein
MLTILLYRDTALASMSKWEVPDETLAFDLCTKHPL